jgi:hypothetical protein
MLNREMCCYSSGIGSSFGAQSKTHSYALYNLNALLSDLLSGVNSTTAIDSRVA